MLLAIDIGNTNIVVALFHEDEITHEWRIHSDPNRTADEYSSIILSFFRDNGISQSYIKSGVLSSVVPLLIGPFIRLMENIIGRKPIILGPSIYDKLPVTIPKSALHEIGTDLVANSVQAFVEYKKPCIIADFGTALTFTAIDDKGNIQGVAIAPGIKTAVNSIIKKFIAAVCIFFIPTIISALFSIVDTVSSVEADYNVCVKCITSPTKSTCKNAVSGSQK